MSEGKSGAQHDLPHPRRRQPDSKGEQRSNQNHQQKRGAQDSTAVALAGAHASGEGEHTADDGPGEHVNDPADQSDCGVDAGFRGGEEVFYKNDIEVVDDDLADEEHDRLNAFLKGRRQSAG